MLRIRMNRRNSNLTYRELTGSNGQQNSISDTDGTIRINTTDTVNTFHYPAVHFVREDGGIMFHDSRKITGGKIGEYVDTEKFPWVRAYVKSLEVVENARRSPGDAPIRKFVKINLTAPHNNATYRDYGIDEVLSNPDTFETGGYNNRRCAGDHLLYEWFLYEIKSVRNNEYLFSNAVLLNNRQRMTIYSEDFSDGSKLINCYVPVSPNNIDSINSLVWEVGGSDSEILGVLENNRYSEIYIEDCRFFDRTQNSGSGRVYISMRPGTRLCLESGNLRVSVPIAEDFATNLFMEDALDVFASARSESYINGIVDYEKMKFVPCYVSDTDVKLYNSITFNIHLRDRAKNPEWKVEDDLYWAAWPDVSGNADNTLGSDLVSALGFDDADIYYQKAKVKNTFLRLSFYNSDDRRTQQLLYTAKIYLDAGKLFGKFIKNAERYGLETQVDDDGSERDGDFDPLRLTFTCSSSLDTGNTSEGFYIFLFPSNLNDGDKGEIFMKAELNNSKYGYTVPLSMPRDCGGNLLKLGNGKFPVHYIKKDGAAMSPDMVRFRHDTFIPLTIFKEDGRFYWKFGSENYSVKVNDSDDLEVTLIEPRMNGEESPTFQIDCDS